ncbi:MAG: hypothetical protein CM15mP74_07460 [Halieaceae bacterium]|nr:MAG: hypothetical protein CM15mP74_07460 [Halieaceae bacterium]
MELDGARLDSTQYQIESGQLVIQSVPDGCTLRTCVDICPEDNTSLEGFIALRAPTAQCEAEGFRKITYFPDRPDVLAVYTVTLEARARPAPFCSATVTLSAKRNLRAVVTEPSGTTLSPNPVTCLPWWQGISSALAISLLLLG